MRVVENACSEKVLEDILKKIGKSYVPSTLDPGTQGRANLLADLGALWVQYANTIEDEEWRGQQRNQRSKALRDAVRALSRYPEDDSDIEAIVRRLEARKALNDDVFRRVPQSELNERFVGLAANIYRRHFGRSTSRSESGPFNRFVKTIFSGLKSFDYYQATCGVVVLQKLPSLTSATIAKTESIRRGRKNLR